MLSIRLWSVPITTLMESDDSTKSTVEVKYCAGIFLLFFFFNFSGYTTNSQFYKLFLLFCSQQVFMFGRMHFGKFWSKLSQRKILKLVILFDFYVYWTFFTFFFRGADHQWDGEHFATAGAQVDIWNHNRCWSISVCSTYFTKITVDFSKFHVYFMLFSIFVCVFRF